MFVLPGATLGTVLMVWAPGPLPVAGASLARRFHSARRPQHDVSFHPSPRSGPGAGEMANMNHNAVFPALKFPQALWAFPKISDLAENSPENSWGAAEFSHRPWGAFRAAFSEHFVGDLFPTWSDMSQQSLKSALQGGRTDIVNPVASLRLAGYFEVEGRARTNKCGRLTPAPFAIETGEFIC